MVDLSDSTTNASLQLRWEGLKEMQRCGATTRLHSNITTGPNVRGWRRRSYYSSMEVLIDTCYRNEVMLVRQLEDVEKHLVGLIKQLKEAWGNNRAKEDGLLRLTWELDSMRLRNSKLVEEVTVANGEARELSEVVWAKQCRKPKYQEEVIVNYKRFIGLKEGEVDGCHLIPVRMSFLTLSFLHASDEFLVYLGSH
ncbi:hypothetical protein BHM03_00008481 [Ensete ventricosum]|nr:hypothetical protein BHM03_00008481 [Ensete ventricosum]